MTRISNQDEYKPDFEISELDFIIGSDYDNNNSTVNFRIRELADYFSKYANNFLFNYIFIFQIDESSINVPDGYFYSKLNISVAISIQELYFSKKTYSGVEVSKIFNFLNTYKNDFRLKLINPNNPNDFFTLNITSVSDLSSYFKLVVTHDKSPASVSLINETTYTLYLESKSSGFSGDYNDLDNLPTIPTPLTLHSQLILDDGTNPHGTTKSDVGLSNVPNIDTTNAVNNTHTHENKPSLDLVSGTNTGDETTSTIQTKRPLKTINGNSLEGNGDVSIQDTNFITVSSLPTTGIDQTKLYKLPDGSFNWYNGSTWTVLNPPSSSSNSPIILGKIFAWAHTGTTAQTKSTPILIPANSMSLGSMLDFIGVITGVSKAATAYIRLAVSPNEDGTGSSQIATATMTTANNYLEGQKLSFSYQGSNILRGYNSSTSNLTDVAINNTIMTDTAFDPTVNNYFFITIQLGNIADTVTVQSSRLILIP